MSFVENMFINNYTNFHFEDNAQLETSDIYSQFKEILKSQFSSKIVIII